MPTDPLFERLGAVLRTLAPNGRLGIAFSGGLDSRFLAHAAASQGLSPILLHACGPHMAPAESAGARAWAEQRGLLFRAVAVNPLDQPSVADNAPDRCYACKRFLFTTLLQTLREAGNAATNPAGAGPDLPLCDGSNLSDRQGYRPGMRAIQELGIRSPLAEAGFDKPRIRELAWRTGLDDPDQQARPCMLTRLAYGLRPTADLLARLARAEASVAGILADLSGEALPDFRLRVPAQGRTLLHLTVDVSPRTRRELAGAVAGCGLPEPEIERVSELSGYFDRLREAAGA